MVENALGHRHVADDASARRVQRDPAAQQVGMSRCRGQATLDLAARLCGFVAFDPGIVAFDDANIFAALVRRHGGRPDMFEPLGIYAAFFIGLMREPDALAGL
ncbi:hypothetical protein LXJ58_33770, partial [Escherichia coli]|nr:hypothetical protein [Escherichia coli]